MAATSPTVAQREFTARLKARREELDMSAAAVSEAMGFSRNYFSAIENNRTTLAAERLDDLLATLELSVRAANELRELHSVSRTRGWWADYLDLIQPEFAEYCGLEHGASHARAYETLVVTGLLQTADYARALAVADPTASRSQYKRYWEVRRRRQQRLTATTPLTLTALFSEAVLMQEIGGKSVLRDQLRYLLRLSADLSENLEIRIQPFTTTPLGLLATSNVVLLDFATDHLPTLVWLDAARSSPQPDPGVYQLEFEQALETSLDRATSRQLIQSRLDELEAR